MRPYLATLPRNCYLERMSVNNFKFCKYAIAAFLSLLHIAPVAVVLGFACHASNGTLNGNKGIFVYSVRAMMVNHRRGHLLT